MAVYKTTGIVLRRTGFRENDRLFVVYTKDYGKIQAVARGSRKIKSKLAAHLEPFNLTEIMVARGRNFDQLAGALLKKRFSGITPDLQKIVLINYCFEVVDQLTEYQHQDKQIFDLLSSLLVLLDRNNYELRNLIDIFVLKLLSQLGYTPELYYCLGCKRKLVPSQNVFVPSRGGIFCFDCGQKYPDNIQLTVNTIKVLRLGLKRDLENILKIKVGNEIWQEVNKINTAFLEEHLDRELESKKSLARFC